MVAKDKGDDSGEWTTRGRPAHPGGFIAAIMRLGSSEHPECTRLCSVTLKFKVGAVAK